MSTAVIDASSLSRASSRVCMPGPQATSRIRGARGKPSTIENAIRVETLSPGPSRGRPEWISQNSGDLGLAIRGGSSRLNGPFAALRLD
jgi:hypothetical protein